MRATWLVTAQPPDLVGGLEQVVGGAGLLIVARMPGTAGSRLPLVVRADDRHPAVLDFERAIVDRLVSFAVITLKRIRAAYCEAGPKGAITAPPLDLAQLPRSGPRRVEAFAREYLKVTRGKGARGPFRLRPWQKQIVGQLLPSKRQDEPRRCAGRVRAVRRRCRVG